MSENQIGCLVLMALTGIFSLIVGGFFGVESNRVNRTDASRRMYWVMYTVWVSMWLLPPLGVVWVNGVLG